MSKKIIHVHNVIGEGISCDMRITAEGRKWVCPEKAVAMVTWEDDSKYLCRFHYDQAREQSES